MRFESGMVVPAARELLGKIVPGYGVTVHTMQGDSVKDAYLLVESAAPVDREMTYTAVTRGTESFTFMFDSVYGSINGMIMSAVSKQRPERRTLLAEFIGKDVDVPPQQQTTCSFCSTVRDCVDTSQLIAWLLGVSLLGFEKGIPLSLRCSRSM